MSYQLDWLQTLEAMFWADDIILIVLNISLQIILPLFVYIALCKARKSYMTKIVVVCSLVFVTILSFLFIWGNGWYVHDGTLYLKAHGTSADIKITSMEVTEIDFYGEWEPVIRTNAAGLPFLATGKYRLKNGRTALVFVHYLQKKVLLIHANKTYYIIGHPFIEHLYDELLQRGATKHNFENNGVIQ